MRGKVAKALRRMAARQVERPDTEYDVKIVKEVRHQLLDGRYVILPHYRTTVTRTSRRAFYQWLKREFVANRVALVA